MQTRSQRRRVDDGNASGNGSSTVASDVAPNAKDEKDSALQQPEAEKVEAAVKSDTIEETPEIAAEDAPEQPREDVQMSDMDTLATLAAQEDVTDALEHLQFFKATPLSRPRTTIACEPCRAFKRKCSGEKPCALCIRRGRENDCRYEASSSSVMAMRRASRKAAAQVNKLANQGGSRSASFSKQKGNLKNTPRKSLQMREEKKYVSPSTSKSAMESSRENKLTLNISQLTQDASQETTHSSESTGFEFDDDVKQTPNQLHQTQPYYTENFPPYSQLDRHDSPRKLSSGTTASNNRPIFDPPPLPPVYSMTPMRPAGDVYRSRGGHIYQGWTPSSGATNWHTSPGSSRNDAYTSPYSEDDVTLPRLHVRPNSSEDKISTWSRTEQQQQQQQQYVPHRSYTYQERDYRRAENDQGVATSKHIHSRHQSWHAPQQLMSRPETPHCENASATFPPRPPRLVDSPPDYEQSLPFFRRLSVQNEQENPNAGQEHATRVENGDQSFANVEI